VSYILGSCRPGMLMAPCLLLPNSERIRADQIQGGPAMRWIASYWAMMLVIALGAFFVAFLSKNRSARWSCIAVGIASLLLLVGSGLHIALTAPDGVETIDEDRHPLPRPKTVNALESLTLSWDSDGPANWPVAELLASMSDTSYLPPVDAEAGLLAIGFHHVQTVADGSMIGYVASTDDATVIVFRGTDNNIDWIVNLTTAALKLPEGAMHKGFHDAYQPLKPQIAKLLKENETKHLWITGHSLGGALAVVCAHDLMLNEHRGVDGLITFGQPMVVQQPLANRLEGLLVKRYAHYVNGSDIVARIPPGYSRIGSMVWFDGVKVKRPKPRIAIGVEVSEFTESFSEAPALDEQKIKPLTEQEFEELKFRLQTEDLNLPQFNADPDTKTGFGPWIDDHAMSEYLMRIRLLGAGASNTTGSNESQP
jgi:triacylglycerol lipase